MLASQLAPSWLRPAAAARWVQSLPVGVCCQMQWRQGALAQMLLLLVAPVQEQAALSALCSSKVGQVSGLACVDANGKDADLRMSKACGAS